MLIVTFRNIINPLDREDSQPLSLEIVQEGMAIAFTDSYTI